jgi:hypothetical protein
VSKIPGLIEQPADRVDGCLPECRVDLFRLFKLKPREGKGEAGREASFVLCDGSPLLHLGQRIDVAETAVIARVARS